jgi:hypothetical protein
VPVASGPTPGGDTWHLSASIRKNGTCAGGWLFAVNVDLPQIGHWSSATGIPVGGHTARYFNISAADEASFDGSEHTFAGYTGREATKVLATMADGTRIEIHPRFPPQKLRRQFVWLRSFRYFVRYYPPETQVSYVSLFDRAGTLLYRSEPGSDF